MTTRRRRKQSTAVEPWFVPSRFNTTVRDTDGNLLIFNSFTSALLQFRDESADAVAAILRAGCPPAGDLVQYLVDHGVVVPDGCDELDRAQRLHERPFEIDDTLGLTLLAHENCNFRCVYCYEEFKKGRMQPAVVEGVKALVRRRAERLRFLSLSWFGGEPLLAMDVVEDVSVAVRAICQEQGIAFAGQMTTNGSLLDADHAARCIASGISRYQVTLDGPAETHNRLRVLAKGGGTYDTVLGNLRHFRDHASGFHLLFRVNFSPMNLPLLPDFVQFLGREFGHDPRFSISFHRVGHLGGPHDAAVAVCGHKNAEEHEIALTELAMQAGFSLEHWKNGMQRYGSMCYAASPRHYVVGSDGTVYKCTVAFTDPRNHVGRLDREGNLHLQEDLVTLWTRSGEETDSGCQQCGFRPACQGNVCPLERLNGLEKRCPITKTNLSQLLPMFARDAHRDSASHR